MPDKVNYQRKLGSIIEKIENGRNVCTAEGDSRLCRPSLLMHSCCAPCSSYCMEYLREYFDITVFYYNPNISASTEYRKRVEEEKRLIAEYNRQVDRYFSLHNTDSNMYPDGENMLSPVLVDHGMTITANTGKIKIIEGDYDPNEFFDIARGYEKCAEGGERCFRCFELRLRRSFELADKLGMDYVTSTLTISPLKNAPKINEIGYELESEFAGRRKNDRAAAETGISEDTGLRWLPSDFKKRNGYKRSIELSHEFGLYRQNFCGCVYSRTARDEAADITSG